jgi:hypothetical protein
MGNIDTIRLSDLFLETLAYYHYSSVNSLFSGTQSEKIDAATDKVPVIISQIPVQSGFTIGTPAKIECFHRLSSDVIDNQFCVLSLR